MQRYSIFSLARNALTGHQNWQAAWRSPEPKPAYDVVIVGAGGHGLATAYYLAKEHGITNVAVLERGWLGGGNTGRNTTICRSNYLYDESAAFYDHALKLWEGLSQELNYNVMFSPRGVMMLAHTVHDVQVAQRHIHANRLNGVDNEWLTPAQAKAFCPPLNLDHLRYPVLGAALQRRGGTARHDAVAWGYARGADARGVDIIQNCEVTGIRREGDRVVGVETGRGFIAAKKVAVVAAGHTSVVMALAGPADAPGEHGPAGAGLRAGQARVPVRGDVQHHPRLHQPVGQGRAGDRRGLGPVQFLQPARQLPDRRAHAGGDLRAVPDLLAHAHAAPLGRHRRRHRRPLADRRQDAAAGPLRQLRLGYRRLQGDAGLGPRVRATRWPRTSRTRSTRRSRSSASPPAG